MKSVITREHLIMSKNYVAVSRAIVDAIGGSENITAITHCMTRLRLVLKSDKPVDLARLKVSMVCWV